MEPSYTAPPPWSLTGEGLVLLYHIPQNFNRQHGFMADFQQRGYIGWVGAVILADYKTSGVGPYRELMYIPGLFRLGGKLTFSISKIFVSTYESVWNGRQNWGIPKELADFHIAARPDGMQVYEVSITGRPFFEVQVKPWGPRLPISSKLIPFAQITQQRENQLLLTPPTAVGGARLASLKHLATGPEFFPPLHLLKPLLVLSIPDFRMAFPIPVVLY